jgi:L-rhamnose mutarotase
VQRVCFLLKVRSSMREEYVRRHESVWPEMLEALKASGWNNYSIFLDESGLLVGYWETDDLAAAQAAMATTAVNAKWQESMSPFFEGLDGDAAGEHTRTLPMVFQLETQLGALNNRAASREA